MRLSATASILSWVTIWPLLTLYAQERGTSLRSDLLYQHPRYIAKLAGSGFMDAVHPAVQVGLEQFLSTRASLQYEMGAIWARYPYDALAYGYTLRGAYRHYYHPIAAGDADNFFWSLRASWQQVFTTRYDWVDRYDGAFSQYIRYRNQRNSAGVAFHMGGMWYIRRDLTFETSLGMGVKWLQVRNVGLPDDAVFPDTGGGFPTAIPPEEGDYLRPVFSFTLEVGKVF